MIFRTLKSFLGFSVFLLGWAIVTETGLVNSFFIASPSDTALAFVRGASNGTLTTASIATTCRVLVALLIAAMIGFPLGLLIGGFSSISDLLRPLVDVLRSIPGTALFPAFIVLFGLTEASRIAGPSLTGIWTVTIFVAAGVPLPKSGLRHQMRLRGAWRSQIFIDGVLMPSLPNLFVGMRVAVGLMMTTTIGVEMIVGADQGLGQQIYQSQLTFSIPEMYAAIAAAGILGLGLNALFTWIVGASDLESDES
ncbi:MAG: ABC transporter permease [Planctomycetia bacterium]